MNRLILAAAMTVVFGTAASAQDPNARITDLERRLDEARRQADALQQSIAGLASELRTLRQAPAEVSEPRPSDAHTQDDHAGGFRKQIVQPDLGFDERSTPMSVEPELFVQSRFQAAPLHDATVEDAPSNFNLTRMESRWAGRLSPRVGMGFEIQYHPAPAGASEEIVNDAFVELYPSRRITLRAGQFVKPFGFDIQQSSSERESPERGIFAGYFFPGQRDRGVMATARFDSGLALFAGVFNGNRFFNDSNRRVNVNLRARKVFETLGLATGVSAQFGEQVVPDDLEAGGHENLFGADVQWAWNRLGVRAEIVGGDRPSTLLGLQPELAPAFSPGSHSIGGSVFSGVRLSSTDQIYARYDRFNGDPVFGYDVHAFNVGYLKWLGEHSRFGLDYQWKNHLTANDDQLNTRLQVTINVYR